MKLCCPLVRLSMVNERAVGRWVLWVIQPPPGAFDAKVNDCTRPGSRRCQLKGSDAHGGVGVDGAFNAGVVGWPEMAEPALGADEQAVASSRATRRAVTFRMSKP